MLSPTDADFTEAGTVCANITQFSLSLSGNYGDTFCFRALNVNGPGDVVIPPRLKTPPLGTIGALSEDSDADGL
jgi:hypothetical protein